MHSVCGKLFEALRCRRERRWSAATPRKCSRDTCWSCRAGCCCRTCAPAIGTCTMLRARPFLMCRRRPTQVRATSAPNRLPQKPPPNRSEHTCRCCCPNASAVSADPPPQEHSRNEFFQLRDSVGRKKFERAPLVVISHAVALAPFSQNSNGFAGSGLAYEQLTQAKPRGLFWCHSA